MSWATVILVIIVLGVLGWSFAVGSMRTAECKEHGGLYVGGRGGAQCIKDGKIIIIWKVGGPVYNP